MELTKSFDVSQSRSVRKIEYHPASSELDITFNTGKTYRYSGVSGVVWEKALDAPSIGSFVQQQIKNRNYAYKLLN